MGLGAERCLFVGCVVTESGVQNSNISTASALSAAQQIPDLTRPEQPEHRYVNADTLKVHHSPKGDALDTLKRRTSVRCMSSTIHRVG